MSIRLQHIIPASAVLLLAIVVSWISFTEEPADAFLFPRLISVAMLLLALWNFARAAMGIAKVGTGFTKDLLLKVAPGIFVTLIYIFYLAKWLGFYTSSTLVFVLLFAIYDPASHTELKSWIKRIAFAIIFMMIMYGLFNLLLKVQTPRGMFF